MAETDPSVIPEVDSSRYRMTGGMLEVPDAPGFGLDLDHTAVDAQVRERGWSVTV
jgi:L-alanine-DL-glutamate epimerase-like enolase superfamily enzyme